MRFWPILASLFLLSACVSAMTPTLPAADATDLPIIDVNATLIPTRLSSGEFTLILYSPADGDVVSQPQVELKGRTSVETVMTVNDEIYLLAGQQDFTILVSLEEGPNAIEIVASDYAGNEIDLVLTVTYQTGE